MSVVLAVAPHPDDETLGCGGTLLRHRADGDEVHWLIVTAMTAEGGFSAERMAARDVAITATAAEYGFAGVYRAALPTARLDALPLGDVVAKVGAVIKAVAPEVVYVPFPGDAHSDHRVVFDAVAACAKWFRYPSIRRLLACEIPSETDAGLRPDQLTFRPNSYCDIGSFLEDKIGILIRHFAEEMGTFPFPRSPELVRALAMRRGAECGCAAAESFMLLKEIR